MDGLVGGRIVVAEEAGSINDRALFHALLNIDENHHLLATALEISEAAFDVAADTAARPGLLPPTPDGLGAPEWPEAARQWRADLFARVVGRLDGVTPDVGLALLRQCAPSAVADGAWSQYVSDAACSHTPITALLLRPFVARMGAGDVAAHIGNTFLDLLRALGQAVAEPTSWVFARDEALVDAAFAAPVFRLAVSLFPQRFLPEILGIDLFEAVRGTHPIAEALEELALGHGGGARFFVLRRAFEEGVAPARIAVTAIATFLAASPLDAERAWSRIRTGYVAAELADAGETEALLDWAHGPAFTPRAKMVELVRRKAESAVGYHGRGKMRERSLDDWFTEAERDPAAFVDALAEAPWVVPGDSAGSPLLSNLIGTRGPMAGIFTKPEIAVVARWIDSLPDDFRARLPEPLPPRTHRVLPLATPEPGDVPVRDLYHRMLHAEVFPETLHAARKFASGWLTRAGRMRPGDPRPLPFDAYSPTALEAWLRAQHARQVATFQAADGAPPISREALIESSVQLCPTILIDGAWLQRFNSVATAGTDVGAKLFRIYLDEVGDGDTVENHPNVYRDLMARMGVDMPEFGTLEFAHWPGFLEASFQLPTFWLCVSQFPKQFLPEILGLNLAIELSGVGGTYRTTSHALRYYGYDSLFVDLHNTVDNVSTGHTAIALAAVVSHLDEMLARGGRAEVQRRWQRVWTGFRSLAGA